MELFWFRKKWQDPGMSFFNRSPLQLVLQVRRGFLVDFLKNVSEFFILRLRVFLIFFFAGTFSATRARNIPSRLSKWIQFIVIVYSWKYIFEQFFVICQRPINSSEKQLSKSEGHFWEHLALKKSSKSF